MPMAAFSQPIRRFTPGGLSSFAERPRHAAQPIGLFDSGVGGLTVAAALARRLPQEHFLYIADQAHVPYGGRPLAEVEGFAASLTGHLLGSCAKLVVMACNISSATAMGPVRRALGPDRVFGMIEAGARAALRASRLGRVGVLATQGTVQTGAYPQALGGAVSHQVPCPKFVPLIEAGLMGSPEARAAALEALWPLRQANVDTVILGCTHYPLLLPDLEAAALSLGYAPTFVDPAEEVAAEVEAALTRQGLSASAAGGGHLFGTTGPLRTFEAQRTRFVPGLKGVGVDLGWAPETARIEPTP